MISRMHAELLRRVDQQRLKQKLVVFHGLLNWISTLATILRIFTQAQTSQKSQRCTLRLEKISGGGCQY